MLACIAAAYAAAGSCPPLVSLVPGGFLQRLRDCWKMICLMENAVVCAAFAQLPRQASKQSNQSFPSTFEVISSSLPDN